MEPGEIYKNVEVNGGNGDFVQIDFSHKAKDYVNDRFFGVVQSVELLAKDYGELKFEILPLHDMSSEWSDLLNVPPDYLVIQDWPNPRLFNKDFYILEENSMHFLLASFLQILETKKNLVNREKYDRYLKIINLKFKDLYIKVFTPEKSLMVYSLNLVYLKR